VDRPLTAGQAGALTDFIYNLGSGNFESSTMLKDLNGGLSNAEIAAQIELWDRSGGQVLEGLENRRKTEAVLYTSGKMVFFENGGTETVVTPA
jgi:lysozyme